MKKFILLSMISFGTGYAGIAQSNAVSGTPTQVLSVSATPAGVAYHTVTSGINEVSLDKAIRIYPNPAIHEITVVSAEGYNIADCDIFIYDEKGRLVLTEKNQSLKGKATSVNVQHLPTGLYTLTVKTSDNNAVINKRFVISK